MVGKMRLVDGSIEEAEVWYHGLNVFKIFAWLTNSGPTIIWHNHNEDSKVTEQNKAQSKLIKREEVMFDVLMICSLYSKSSDALNHYVFVPRLPTIFRADSCWSYSFSFVMLLGEGNDHTPLSRNNLSYIVSVQCIGGKCSVQSFNSTFYRK